VVWECGMRQCCCRGGCQKGRLTKQHAFLQNSNKTADLLRWASCLCQQIHEIITLRYMHYCICLLCVCWGIQLAVWLDNLIQDYYWTCLEINLSWQARGFDGVLYNLWLLVAFKNSGTCIEAGHLLKSRTALFGWGPHTRQQASPHTGMARLARVVSDPVWTACGYPDSYNLSTWSPVHAGGLFWGYCRNMLTVQLLHWHGLTHL